MTRPNLGPDWERVYRELAQLIGSMPAIDYKTKDDPAVVQWLARTYAIVDEVGRELGGSEAIEFKFSVRNLGSSGWQRALSEITAIIHRAWALAERKAPPSIAGSFIPAGGEFDAMASVGKVFKAATRDLLIVDPYMDEATLSDFAVTAAPGVMIRLLSDEATVKPSLQPAGMRWVTQHGLQRPIAIRLAPSRTLHDRAFFVDGSSVWLVSQSLNAIAARSPATIERANDPIAQAKVPAYEAVWASAKVIL